MIINRLKGNGHSKGLSGVWLKGGMMKMTWIVCLGRRGKGLISLNIWVWIRSRCTRTVASATREVDQTKSERKSYRFVGPP